MMDMNENSVNQHTDIRISHETKCFVHAPTCPPKEFELFNKKCPM